MGWVTVNGIPRFYEDSPHTCSECEAVIPTHHEQCRKHYFEHINANKKPKLRRFGKITGVSVINSLLRLTPVRRLLVITFNQ